MFEEFARLLLAPAGMLDLPFEQAADTLVTGMAWKSLELLLPFLGIVVVGALLAEMLQVGVLFAFEAIKPSGKKLNVGANLKNMFAAKSWVELLKSVLKVAVLSTVVAMLLASAKPP